MYVILLAIKELKNKKIPWQDIYIYIAFRISFTPFTLCMFIYRYFNPFIWIFFLNKNLPKFRNENNFGR